MSGILLEITIILCLAAFFTVLFRILKQPAILAYLLTGIVVGPVGQIQFANTDGLHMMAQFGVTLLLFMLGLELKLSDLRSIGKSAILIGVPQIVFTSLIGYIAALQFGFSVVVSLYIAAALSFSSTIIIVKLLSNKRDLQSLHGKIAIGILLIQDFAAVFILMLLSVFTSAGTHTISTSNIALVFAKATILFSLIIFLSKKIFPIVVDKFAKSEETLLLFSLAFALGLAAFVSSPSIGFSVEIGGFLAGLALAQSLEHFQIAARVRALQEFFITIFFVTLGMDMVINGIGTVLPAVIIFTLFILFGKPLIIMLIMGIFGYRKRTMFLTGIHMGQISEFSLVILFLGNKLSHVPSDVVSLMTAIGIVSFGASTYMSIYANKLYIFAKKYLSIFEIHAVKVAQDIRGDSLEDITDHVALIGANRMGRSILEALQEEGEKVIVVDFDPDIVHELNSKGVVSIFGDIGDLDIQERVKLHKAKLIISTVGDLEDNLYLLHGLAHVKIRPKVIVVARDFTDAKKLYERGADYVVVPHFLGGKHLAKMIKDNTLEKLDSRKAAKDFGRGFV
ncbi:MAG: cation:proton antiporter [Candidatus Levybacteria bacterium]|nr:cation:proton antiporter [Candidatus Levybacteria bacterium]